MKIEFATLDNCAKATDTAVVIDVIRAFTTAAFAFAAGAKMILPVNTVDEALALREQFPGALVMGHGDEDMFVTSGFNFSNSPAALMDQTISTPYLIQRTGAGTPGLVRSAGARVLLAASFVCAGATVRTIRRHAPETVTLVSTSSHGEDQACAEYLAALLREEAPETTRLLAQARAAGQQRIDKLRATDRATEHQLTGFEADLDYCTSLDHFNFAMQVESRGGLLYMTPVQEGA